MDSQHDLLYEIHRQFTTNGREINRYSPLTLAYMGDAVYEIIIRTLIVENKSGSVKNLHKQCTSLVNAGVQAEIMACIEPRLTENEYAVYKRGRNAKSHSVAKNADVHDYRVATGFEALMGYLYLNGETKRCLELVQFGLTEQSK